MLIVFYTIACSDEPVSLSFFLLPNSLSVCLNAGFRSGSSFSPPSEEGVTLGRDFMHAKAEEVKAGRGFGFLINWHEISSCSLRRIWDKERTRNRSFYPLCLFVLRGRTSHQAIMTATSFQSSSRIPTYVPSLTFRLPAEGGGGQCQTYVSRLCVRE